jgi:hypothetical protein
MVTIFSSKSLKFKINERDHNPPHVHVVGLGASIRINLLTLEPMDSETDFSVTAVRRILEVVTEKQEQLLREWSKRHG